MFINLSNHPFSVWSDNQLEAARAYGELTELVFPTVDPSATPEQITTLVDEYREKILHLKPAAILVAGEFTFTFQLVDALIDAGINVVSACSHRKTEEEKKDDGTSVKVSKFDFVGFRPYQHYPVGGE